MRRILVLAALCGAVLQSGCASMTPAVLSPSSPGVSPSPTASPASTAASSTALPAYEWPDAFTLNRRIGRGVNFGDALEAPSEGEWGIVLQEEYFQKAKDAGFSTIRLPVRWDVHALESAPFTIFPSFFERVDWAVERGLSRGMVVILDFHNFLPFMDCPPCERERFLMLWAQIAEHYQAYPPGLVFELLNEPTDAIPAAEWNDALASALAVVRASNPQRIVVVGPVGWNGLGALSSLSLPESDRGLIVTFHYYEPFHFTHQGADWAEGSNAWLGTTWRGSAAEQQAVRNDFESVSAWSTAHGRPILLGEFGAYSKADMDSRARWTAYVARQADELSISWTYWEFCSGFGVYDPAAHRWRDPLLGALLPESPQRGK
jgi:endoglucanase